MFSDILQNYDWEQMRRSIYAKTTRDVEIALSKAQRPDPVLTLEDFKALVSPAVSESPLYLWRRWPA